MEMFQHFAQYFIQNQPRTWNFGRYKQFGQEYCSDKNIPTLSLNKMSFLFTIFHLNESLFEPLGICRFMEMFQHFAEYFLQNQPRTWNFGRYKQFGQEYCSDQNIPTLSTNIYSASWVGFLKEFIDITGGGLLPAVGKFLEDLPKRLLKTCID